MACAGVKVIICGATTVELLIKKNSVCVGDTVNKRGMQVTQYIHSPGGAFSVMSFRKAVIL